MNNKKKLENLKQKIDKLQSSKTNQNQRYKKTGAGFGFKISTEIIAALIVGVCIGLLVDNYFNTKPFGLIIFFGTLGGTIGPVIAGTIFDQTKSYSVAFLLLTGMAALGIILTSQLRPTLPKVSDVSKVE